MQKDQQKLAQLIQGKKVAFIGAGVSHKTLIKEFVELGAHVTLCDQKKSVEDFGDYAATIRELGIDLSLGENYLDGFKGQDIIMRTPGFVGYFEKPLQDAMAAGTMVTSEVELFFDFCPCEIVAVTGSDGKTTTTTLISKFYVLVYCYTALLLNAVSIKISHRSYILEFYSLPAYRQKNDRRLGQAWAVISFVQFWSETL